MSGTLRVSHTQAVSQPLKKDTCMHTYTHMLLHEKTDLPTSHAFPYQRERSNDSHRIHVAR